MLKIKNLQVKLEEEDKPLDCGVEVDFRYVVRDARQVTAQTPRRR